MTLAETAEARKEKIQALRRRKAAHLTTSTLDPNNANGKTTARSKPSEFKFRNYEASTITTRATAAAMQPLSKQHLGEGPGIGGEDTVERAVEGVMEVAKLEDAKRRMAELDLTAIQPKKPNWDLKRDLNKKLEKLEPATRAATATLIRRRMLAQQNGTGEEGSADLALHVAIGSGAAGAHAEGDSSDSDED